MSWESKSDFEINKAVADLLMIELDFTRGDFSLEPHQKLIGDAVSVDILLKRSDGEYFRNASVDYCNNPSDAWPLIVDNAIGVEPDCGGDFLSWRCRDRNYTIEVCGESPLRGAMIVLLEMKGARCE